MQVDTWPKSADRLVEIAGLLMVIAHIAFVVVFVLWFALNRPTSVRVFRKRMRAAIEKRQARRSLRPE